MIISIRKLKREFNSRLSRKVKRLKHHDVVDIGSVAVAEATKRMLRKEDFAYVNKGKKRKWEKAKWAKIRGSNIIVKTSICKSDGRLNMIIFGGEHPVSHTFLNQHELKLFMTTILLNCGFSYQKVKRGGYRFYVGK